MEIVEQEEYRVLAEGLTAAERTVFLGVIRLAERNGRRFRINTSTENVDVYILDGANERCRGIAKSNPQAAHRMIWIDPSEHLGLEHKISRPIHWPVLLRLMERIVGRAGDPDADGVQPQSTEVALDRLCEICEATLRQRIGIAAEFVVDDVRLEIEAAGGARKAIAPDVFLDVLKHQLPRDLDVVRVLQEVAAAITQRRRE